MVTELLNWLPISMLDQWDVVRVRQLRLDAELSKRHGHVQRPAAEPFFDGSGERETMMDHGLIAAMAGE